MVQIEFENNLKEFLKKINLTAVLTFEFILKVRKNAFQKRFKFQFQLMDAVVDRTSKVLTGHFVANKHQPGEIENRVVAQISAERMCYEAAEIWMNENQPNPNISAEDIHKQLVDFVKAAIQKKDAPAKK